MGDTATASRDIMAAESAEQREQVIELLTKAYWMEIETVMSYIANSVNPDGVRAQEIKESLEAGHPGGARARAAVRGADQGALRRRPGLARVQRRAVASCSRPTSRSTSCT